MGPIPEKGDAAALGSFVAACRSRGLSVTHQRIAVYAAVLASRSHPGAEEIFQAVRSRLPTISRGTVYRTLDTLCEIGLVTDVNRTRDTARFEAALDPHHHLVCMGCRRIIDLRDASLGRLPARVGRGFGGRREGGGEAAGFEVTGCQIQFIGYCRECRRGRKASSHPQEGRHGKRAQGHEDPRQPQGGVRRGVPGEPPLPLLRQGRGRGGVPRRRRVVPRHR